MEDEYEKCEGEREKETRRIEGRGMEESRTEGGGIRSEKRNRGTMGRRNKIQ